MSDHGQDNTNSANIPDWEAIARVLANEGTAEEAERVRAWLAAHPMDRQLVERLDEAARPRMADVDVEAALARVHRQMDRGAPPKLTVVRGNASRPRKVYFVSALAAVAAAAVAILVAKQSRSDDTTVAHRTYATSVGQRDSITLPDSSRVILGPMSKLTVAYANSSRSVELQGDAYFDVRHDPSKPFSVRVGRAVVEDIGTTFAIESDAGDTTNVSVITGSVRLRSTDSATTSGAVLAAGDRGSMSSHGEVRSYPHTVTEDAAAWTSGKLVFKGASLVRVTGELRRWYGVTLRVDSSLAGRHLDAEFSGEPVDQVLKIIGLDLGARIERQGDTATVTPIRGPNSTR